jgi:hypothetical protein
MPQETEIIRHIVAKKLKISKNVCFLPHVSTLKALFMEDIRKEGE